MKAVTAYMERLLKLASNASLRAEMTQFALSRTAEQPVLAEHRAGESCPQLWVKPSLEFDVCLLGFRASDLHTFNPEVP